MSHRQNRKRRPGPRQNNLKSLRRWHRWVGYISLALILILSITGIILNRTESLNLNQIPVKNDVISYLYGMTPSEDAVHFQADQQWVSWLEGRLYLDGKIIAQNIDRPVGATKIDEMIVIASENSLALYLADGTLIETLDQSSLPGKTIDLGKTAQNIVIIRNDEGLFAADPDFISWTNTPDDPGGISYSRPTPAPPQIEEAILQDFQGQGISLYRLILDLHSGHILGRYGSYLMDFAAICLIFLGITGVMNRRPNGKDSRQRKNKS